MRAALASDRGHQAPLASLCGSPFWQEADYLSNITPQRSDLNEGAWERLENGERKLIEERFTDAVYSITGPLYEIPMPPLPFASHAHRVPSGYWKVISIVRQGELEVAAFIMPQDTARDADYCSFEVPLKNIEQRSGWRFFPKLNVDKRTLIESEMPSANFRQNLGC